MEPAQGIIVWLWRHDSNGQNLKKRAFVIITPTAIIKLGDCVVGVAISTRISNPPLSKQIVLPWQHYGHPKTGLSVKSAAICDWFTEIPLHELQDIKHWCPQSHLLKILEFINGLDPRSKRWSPPPS